MNALNPEFRIVEIFESLQGEGYNTGMPAIFIRLGRCDLSCTWCDTDYLKYEVFPLSQILTQLERYSARTIIITGGEPVIHPRLTVLLDALKARGYRLCIETNGLHPVPEQIDYIATSPKACYAPRYQDGGLSQADEVRIVVDVDGLLSEVSKDDAPLTTNHLDIGGSMPLGVDNINADMDSQYAVEPASTQVLHAPSHIQEKIRACPVISAKERAFMQFAQAMAEKINAKHYYLSPLEQGGHMNIHQTIRLIGLLNSGLINPLDKMSLADDQVAGKLSDMVAQQEPQNYIDPGDQQTPGKALDKSPNPSIHWQLSVQTHKWAGIE